MGRKTFVWKCRCMGNGNLHDGGVELMSGTWKVHMSLIHSIYPYGLHREFYRFNGVSVEDFFDDEDCWELVRIRNSHCLLRL